jgi:division protein CdvB (Snf7/Vps24/ESCRT-III family)
LEINKQQRALDRQKRGIENEEQKVKRSIKQIAKKGDIKTCKMLAKELVRSQKQKDRIVTSKAQLNSITMQLQHQLGKYLNYSFIHPIHIQYSFIHSFIYLYSLTILFFFAVL